MRKALAILLILSWGCEKDQTAEMACKDVSCPVGTVIHMEAATTEQCSGSASVSVESEAGSVEGECYTEGTCTYVCAPPSLCCGTEEWTKDSYSCDVPCCPNGTPPPCSGCGDGVCGGSENATDCPEDCSDTCGDGVCTGEETPEDCPNDCENACGNGVCDREETPESCPNDCENACGNGVCDREETPENCPNDCENACGNDVCDREETPENCPQDCADECIPNETLCSGNVLLICRADGTDFLETDCGSAGLVCLAGTCQLGFCGDGICLPSEAMSCAQDCATICTPNTAWCEGTVMVRCSANGMETSTTDCALSGQVCGNGACVTSGVCPNGICEEGEDEANCREDCFALCGNGDCEVGEQISCAEDCTVCGNKICEAGEMEACPQDCSTCGNGSCELNEPQTCPQDCAECGNGTCELNETETCPQDCGVCEPGTRACAGPLLLICSANGLELMDVDCAVLGQTCGNGNCVDPDVCGNTVCETNEDLTCPADCADVCGDSFCGPTETMSSCSLDCKAMCGNGVCELGESGADCGDCIVTCGDGTCNNSTESRALCPQDCGYCGDLECQDGYETALADPPAGLEACRIDCVVLGCQKDSDCDDTIGCTADTCVAGGCVYSPSDSLCAEGEKCMARSGCCYDRDGDGYTAEECGGSDCDDGDENVHPGAMEICGSGDRNCNGVHRPALVVLPTQVTTDRQYDKAHLGFARGPSRVLLAWVGQPLGSDAVQYAMANLDGLLTSEIKTMEDSFDELISDSLLVKQPYFIAGEYSEESGEFGLVWAKYGYNNWWTLDIAAKFNRIDMFGDLTFPEHKVIWTQQNAGIGVGVDHLARFALTWNSGYFVVDAGGVNVAFISEAGGVTFGASLGCDSYLGQAVAYTGQAFACVNFSSITTYEANGDDIARNAHTSTNLTERSAFAWSGDALVSASPVGSTMQYERILLGGLVDYSEAVADRAMWPLDMLYVPEEEAVAILTTDGSNIYFLVRSSVDGSEALSQGLVAAGTEVEKGFIVKRSGGFGAYWTAKSGALRQIFYAPITCE